MGVKGSSASLLAGNFQNLLSTSRVILGDLFIGSVPRRNTDTGSESLLSWDLKRSIQIKYGCVLNEFICSWWGPTLTH